MASIKLFLASIILSISAFFSSPQAQAPVANIESHVSEVSGSSITIETATSSEASGATQNKKENDIPTPTVATTDQTQAKVAGGVHVYTNEELLSMADNKYANGEVPLGDNKYVTSGPKKGYVYLCNARSDEMGGGAGTDGPWIHGTTWNFLNKVSVSGKVSWPNATFSNIVSGAYRILSGNGLPHHVTGVYPIASSDKAYQYDRNPNSIQIQTLKNTLPAEPVYSDTPYCMGGEAGIMLTGVPLFNAFDATLRDAPAHELQDVCGGHPQVSGEYHYHSMSECLPYISAQTVVGYALDGFPITGPIIVIHKDPSLDKYLTTEDLDECHGLTSEIVVDGKKKTTYHYVMTQDYPYSVSCFRGKPSRTGPSSSPTNSNTSNTQQQQPPSEMQNGTRPEPPQEAKDACNGKTSGAACSVGAQMTGSCASFGSYLACVPK